MSENGDLKAPKRRRTDKARLDWLDAQRLDTTDVPDWWEWAVHIPMADGDTVREAIDDAMDGIA